MIIAQSRRRFLSSAAWVGAAGLGGIAAVRPGGGHTSFAAEPPPEITTIRLEKDRVTCIAPQVAEELLHAEGFTDIRSIEATAEHSRRARAENSGVNSSMIAHGEVDFARDSAPSLVMAMEAGVPVTPLAGLHSGCFEIFGKPDIRSIADLKGRTVGAIYHSGDLRLLQIMTSYVGLDPARDIRWVTTDAPSVDLFVAGKIDAMIAYPPLLQELRTRNVGHVIVSSIVDRPWSEYYCCLLATSTEFARKYPVATKRALRGLLKAADLCAAEPARVAQLMVDRGYAARYDYTLQALNGMRYVWRDYDPGDSLRFYALRLYEAGLVKSSPQKLIDEHTDWRFLNELKRELKA